MEHQALFFFFFFFFLQLLVTLHWTAAQSVCQLLAPSPRLTPFVDPLPLPTIIDVTTGTTTPLVMGAYKFNQKLHRDLPATTLYGYGTSAATATYPGPTIVAMRDVPIKITWQNNILDAEHLLKVDQSINVANPTSGVPIVTHLHGGEVGPVSDGNPNAWFTAGGQTGPAYMGSTYDYPNGQFPTLLWYHDHTMGLTRLNVYAGLAGLYVLTAKEEQQRSNLPSPFSPFHVPLVIQDRQFYANGSLNFPTIGNNPASHPSWCPEFFGDTILVNGKVWPYFTVQATTYRFRILNGANARFFRLSFSNAAINFIKVGSDGSFLSSTITVPAITVAPGERVDVVVDFSMVPVGSQIVLQNSAPAPFPTGPIPTNGVATVMQFQVIQANSPPISSPLIPKIFGPNSYPGKPSTTTRRHTLLEVLDPLGNVISTKLNNMGFADPATETPKLGSTEIWELINLTPDAHPIHLHLVRFRMQNQQPFDLAKYNRNACTLNTQFPDPTSCYTGAAVNPDNDQTGWKDTIVAWPGFVTRLLITFTAQGYLAFPFDPTLTPGYVWHCHIVDHEDNDMMRPLVVIP